ncbi:MAG TPA: hypothetical protein QGF58_07975 [Myxococcota bacterium]|nr:hypothetical protein [Myxococcota bacterium]
MLNVRVVLLESEDQARALARLVYETQGLTHHRGWLYRPEEILARNRGGHVRSFVAMVGPRCVGHLAAIAPHFDEADTPIERNNRVVGLDIIHPDVKGSGVRQRLTTALYGWAGTRDICGLLFRCRTDEVEVQRLARAMGAVPTALSLGAIPRAGQGRPLSILTAYLALADSPEQKVYLPRQDRDVYDALYENLAEKRLFVEDCGSHRLAAATDVRVHFDPSRQIGRIHVVRAGPDLEERVLERFRWLMGGHIRHVTVHSPLETPFTAAATLAWKGHGMVLGGILPGHAGADVAVFQGIRDLHVDLDDLRVLDPFAALLRDRVLADWRRGRDIARPPAWMEAAG